jgi:hypothetical protein
MEDLWTWYRYKWATLSERDSGPSGINRCHNVDRSMSNPGFCHKTVEYSILIARDVISCIISFFFRQESREVNVRYIVRSEFTRGTSEFSGSVYAFKRKRSLYCSTRSQTASQGF